jgi:chromosome segregation ATPase
MNMMNTGLTNIKELQRKLETTMAELEERRRASRGLHDRIASLELENFRLSGELASSRNADVTLEQLNERFNAFQQSYACDIDKLAGLLLELREVLSRSSRPGLPRRLWATVTKKSLKPGKQAV